MYSRPCNVRRAANQESHPDDVIDEARLKFVSQVEIVVSDHIPQCAPCLELPHNPQLIRLVERQSDEGVQSVDGQIAKLD